jgi:hypothetical protein
MKHSATSVLLAAVLCLIINLQSFAQGWDYLDVPQGYETLNLAIEGDTTATGQPKSLNRVYRLERGGAYILNGTIINVKGAPLRVFAAEGSGPKPMIIMGVDEAGAAQDFCKLEGNGHFMNLYICGTDMIGNYNRYSTGIYGDETRAIWDGVNIDATKQSHIRCYGKNQKIYYLNCEFRNSFDLASSGNGRFIDTRGNVCDSIVWQNSTFYVNAQRALRVDGALIKNVVLDHNTFYLGSFGSNTSSATKQSGPLEIGKAVNARVTNNIFRDLALEAMRYRKTIADPPDRIPVIHVDSLKSADYPESSRNWVVRNNAYGWSPEFKAFWATVDTVRGPEFISPYGRSAFFNGTNPNFVESNNFEELVQFADAPAIDAMLSYVKYRYESKFVGTNPPDPRADRNSVGDLGTKPETFGPESDPYNFDYASSHRAYTAADNGLPLGDLNWFPEKKALWDLYQKSSVAGHADQIVTNYTLEQNHPNPFNPTTRITYTLAKSRQISLVIYNMLGQEVARMVDNQLRSAGKHVVVWDGKDHPSGVYYYQLMGSGFHITRKMLLVK